MTEQDRYGHTATLKFDLMMVTIAWPTTMKCSFLLQTGTMMSGVQVPMEAVDGGSIAAIVPS
jgi:hypothetical protein